MPKIVEIGKIVENKQIITDVYQLIVALPQIAKLARPGQFLHVKITGGATLLRRPISIADADSISGRLTLIYRIVGKGTAALAALPVGCNLDCLGPLGNGFSLDSKPTLLVGGGMGIAPLIFLAKKLATEDTAILMGARNKTELFWQPTFQPLVKEVFVTTDDGSAGTKGFTVDLLPELMQSKQYEQICVCGPQIMMEGVARLAVKYKVPCQVSLEKYMACGLGACLSCTCESKTGGPRKKVCTDGPVFWAQEVFDL